MSDLHPDDGLPPWAAELLAGPVPGEAEAAADARARVMAAVRRTPRHGQPLARAYRLAAARPRWARRRGLFTPGGALPGAVLLAASLVLSAVRGDGGAREGAGAAPADSVLTPSVLAASLRAWRDVPAVPRDAVRFAFAVDALPERPAAPPARPVAPGRPATAGDST